MARGSKSAVTQFERNRWLEDLENGKGITKIAQKAKRDIRIVKRHINLAQQEREANQVRRDFLLGRLERHQEILLAEVDRLRGEVHSSQPSLEPGDPLQKKYYTALIAHFKGTSLGKALQSFVNLLHEYRDLLERIMQDLTRLETRVVDRSPNSVATIDWASRLISFLEQGNLYQQPYDTGEKAEQSCMPMWDSFYLTQRAVTRSEAEALIQAHKTLLARAQESSEIIHEQRLKISEVAARISEELDILLVKQYISGHCQYCPLDK